MAGCSTRGIGEGRSELIKITFEIPALQDVEFQTADIMVSLSNHLNDKFNDKLDYSVVVED